MLTGKNRMIDDVNESEPSVDELEAYLRATEDPYETILDELNVWDAYAPKTVIE